MPRPSSVHRRSDPVPGQDQPVAEDAGEDDSSSSDSSDDEFATADEADEATVNLEKADERKRREAERQRVLEAAGLVVKIEPSDTGRPRPRRRPAPSVPARRPQSTISLISDGGGGTIERPLPPTPPPRSPSPEAPPVRVEDAFDRYEKFKQQNSDLTASAPVVNIVEPPSPTTVDPLPPTSPVASVGGAGKLSQFMTRIKSQATATIVGQPEARRASTSLVIGSPIAQSSGATPVITRTSSPAEAMSSVSLPRDLGSFAALTDLMAHLSTELVEHGRRGGYGRIGQQRAQASRSGRSISRTHAPLFPWARLTVYPIVLL